MSNIYGYARISTNKQKIERQIDNILKAYPSAVIVQEAFTGTTVNRPSWNKLYDRVQSGDIIVFDEVSRMSRNAEEGFKVYQELYGRGVNLVFLKEHHIDTEVYKKALHTQIESTGNEIADVYVEATNKVLMILARQQIEIAFQTAQAEVDYLHQRTKEGVLKAKLNGKQVGRATGASVETKKAKETKELILKHSKDFGGSLKDVEVIKLANVDRHSFYKYKAQLKES